MSRSRSAAGKKVGTFKTKADGGQKAPVSLGAFKGDIKSVDFTAECGCVYKYPESYNKHGSGKPDLIAPCPSHKPLPEPRHPRTRQEKMLQVGKFVAEIEGTTRYHRDCDHCEGEHVKDGDDKMRWIHSPRCPYTPMIWWHHGREKADWTCPYGCPGKETPSGLTHNWQCPWWDSHYNPRARTPF